MDNSALKNIRIVLTRPSHPGNIGAAARAMRTMGLRDLRLVAPREFPSDEATTRASGAVDVLERARVHERLADAVSDCVLVVATSSRHRELRHETMDARSAARELIAQSSKQVALVFGNETTGLTAEEAGICNIWAHIPADESYASLNLAAAVQVFAYELRTAATLPDVLQMMEQEFAPATTEQVAQLQAHFERTMTEVGFFNPENPKRLLPRLQRLWARARLEVEEVNILRGFLNSVDKLRK